MMRLVIIAVIAKSNLTFRIFNDIIVPTFIFRFIGDRINIHKLCSFRVKCTNIESVGWPSATDNIIYKSYANKHDKDDLF